MRNRFSLPSISFLGVCLLACGGSTSANKDGSPGGNGPRDAARPPAPRDGAPGNVPIDAPPSGPPPDAFAANCEPVSGTALTSVVIATDPDIDKPVFVTAPPGDPGLFVVAKCGKIHIIDNGAARARASVR